MLMENMKNIHEYPVELVHLSDCGSYKHVILFFNAGARSALQEVP